MAERKQGDQQEPVTSSELKIAGVQISEYRCGVPLQGWESVAAALHTFASGRTKEGRATQQDLEENIGRDHGALGLGLLFLSTSGIDRSKFVDEMLQEAESYVNGDRGHWQRHFDYDAMGTSFFKTSVEIGKLPDQDDGYLLGLNAAYVGKKVEDGLAETLGVEQGLQWKQVNVVLEPQGDKFRIDFDQIAQKLQPLYNELQPTPQQRQTIDRRRRSRKALTGRAIVDTMLARDSWGRSTNSFSLGVKNGIEVSLNLGRVGDRFNWRGGQRDQELWQRQGAVISGPLAESYEDEGKLEPPSITVSIHRYSEEDYNRPPAIDPTMKTTMNELASKVSEAFTQ